jgi:hypothetical protein
MHVCQSVAAPFRSQRDFWQAPELHDVADGLSKPELRAAGFNDLKALTAISEARGVYGRHEA